MSGIVLYDFTDSQRSDVRRFCGFPPFGDGSVVFPYPWLLPQYLALEYRLNHMSQSEGETLVNVYLTNLTSLESAVPGTAGDLDTLEAAVWKWNPNELQQRNELFDSWRRRLCAFIGIEPGPYFVTSRSNSMRLVV
jgi:hypothetical protein